MPLKDLYNFQVFDLLNMASGRFGHLVIVNVTVIHVDVATASTAKKDLKYYA